MIKIERNLLRVGLLLAIGYQVFQILVGLWSGYDRVVIGLNILLGVIFAILLLFAKRNTQATAFILHLVVLFAFAFFWMGTGGMRESVPGMMCLYAAFISTVSRRYLRLISWFLHGTLIYLLVYHKELLEGLSRFRLTDVSFIQQSIEYGVVAAFIAMFVCYMKESYVAFHTQSSRRYQQLQNVGATLSKQNEELSARQEEVRGINENLEALVTARTGEMERKYRQLSEYAFINAHTLRAPLSRVIGLAALMEESPGQYATEKVAQIKSLALDMDLIVREISQVLD